MAPNLSELTQEAMRLPADDRATLAESLLLTIDETHDQLVDDALAVEVERRLRNLREGKVKGIPAEQVMREARVNLRRRP